MNMRFFTLCLALGALVTSAWADSAADVRRRMEARLPDIDRLKTQQIVGETNRGFLQVVQNGNGEADRLVSAENGDREIAYAEIAKETGSSTETVGRARAKKLAANSRSGVWLQMDSGQWYLKK
jgi:uncharacterized protein YdbL (DUF1318 family)